MVPMIDHALALTQAGLLGYDARVVALLLPAIELGLWVAIGQITGRGNEGDYFQTC